MTSLTLNLSRYLIYFINIVINTSSIMTSFREDVRGVAGVALATPFFQDLFYMPSRLLAILTPGYPDFWPYDLLAIRPSGHPVMQTSGHPVFWPSGHPAFWSSRLLAIWSSDHLVIQLSGYPVIRPSCLLVIQPSGLLAIPTSGHLSRCLKNVLIGIFLAYLIVGYTNLKFLMSSLTSLNLSHTRKTEPKSCSSAAGNDTGIS